MVLLPALPQVWNTDKHSELVRVIHLRGAAWSRRKRQFLMHDATPPLLAAGSPADRCA